MFRNGPILQFFWDTILKYIKRKMLKRYSNIKENVQYKFVI